MERRVRSVIVFSLWLFAKPSNGRDYSSVTEW
jgi:hypothetical protein